MFIIMKEYINKCNSVFSDVFRQQWSSKAQRNNISVFGYTDNIIYLLFLWDC